VFYPIFLWIVQQDKSGHFPNIFRPIKTVTSTTKTTYASFTDL